MKKPSIEVRVDKPRLGKTLQLVVIDNMQDGRYVVMKLSETEPLEGFEPIQAPTLEINPTQAQVLMDDLWACGIRPTEGSGSAGSLAATERHLGDMRAITQALLKKDGADIEITAARK